MKNTNLYDPKVHTLMVNEKEVSAVEYGLIQAKRKYYPRHKVCDSNLSNEFIRQIPYVQESLEVNEIFGILLLNRANFVTGYKIISHGGTAGTVVDAKIVAKYAIDTLSSAIILWHNHPTGNLVPSSSDITLTKRIQGALKLFDITMLDHLIIVSNNEYYSFTDNGTI